MSMNLYSEVVEIPFQTRSEETAFVLAGCTPKEQKNRFLGLVNFEINRMSKYCDPYELFAELLTEIDKYDDLKLYML